MTPRTPAAEALLTIASPLGRIALSGDTEAVTRLEIAVGGRLSTDGAADSPTPVLEQAAAELGEYFAGTRTAFTVPVRTGGS